MKNRDAKSDGLARSLCHGLGLRFRKQVEILSGTLGVLLKNLGTVILCMTVSGTVIRTASTRPSKDYWLPKLAANRKRNDRKEGVLRASGWRVLIVWKCEARD